ncbi:MAG TPA: hypothetical protein PKA00_07910 [Saprospiraceae bacterium]|nr:hypothetical protein [Saprospiraceae bacterium]HMQ82817.1 hypothetical protein [Saprospiraceae bacterium]
MTRTEGKKILIINWKWKLFENRHVNENVLKEAEFDYYTQHIAEGKGKFYEEYQVEKSSLCPDALLVATSIYKVNGQTERLLHALIQQYAKPENRVMLFLHRSNNYEDKDVQSILSHFKDRLAKCFLFAFGRDYIYYTTRRSGLLNDTGGFFMGRDPVTDEKVVIYDEENKLVKQPYFDRVWQYYETEFETKILNLKEELMDCWLPFMLPGKPENIEAQALLGAIEKSDQEDKRAMMYRLRSFLVYYNQLDYLDPEQDFDLKNELEKELETLKALEKKHQESFLFDDCIANLENDAQNGKALVKEIYDECKEKLNFIINGETSQTFSQEEVNAMANTLEELVKVVPGEVD